MSVLKYWRGFLHKAPAVFCTDKELDERCRRLVNAMEIATSRMIKEVAPLVLVLQDNKPYGEFLDSSELYRCLAELQNVARTPGEIGLDEVATAFYDYKTVMDRLTTVLHEATKLRTTRLVYDIAVDTGLTPLVSPTEHSWEYIKDLAVFFGLGDDAVNAVLQMYEEDSCYFVLMYSMGALLEETSATDSQIDYYFRALLIELDDQREKVIA